MTVCCFCHRCKHLSVEWEELAEACNRRAAHLSKAITREQVMGPERDTKNKAFNAAVLLRLNFLLSPAAVGLLGAGVQAGRDTQSGEHGRQRQRPAGHTESPHQTPGTRHAGLNLRSFPFLFCRHLQISSLCVCPLFSCIFCTN